MPVTAPVCPHTQGKHSVAERAGGWHQIWPHCSGKTDSSCYPFPMVPHLLFSPSALSTCPGLAKGGGISCSACMLIRDKKPGTLCHTLIQFKQYLLLQRLIICSWCFHSFTQVGVNCSCLLIGLYWCWKKQKTQTNLKHTSYSISKQQKQYWIQIRLVKTAMIIISWYSKLWLCADWYWW